MLVKAKSSRNLMAKPDVENLWSDPRPLNLVDKMKATLRSNQSLVNSSKSGHGSPIKNRGARRN